MVALDIIEIQYMVTGINHPITSVPATSERKDTLSADIVGMWVEGIDILSVDTDTWMEDITTGEEAIAEDIIVDQKD